MVAWFTSRLWRGTWLRLLMDFLFNSLLGLVGWNRKMVELTSSWWRLSEINYIKLNRARQSLVCQTNEHHQSSTMFPNISQLSVDNKNAAKRKKTKTFSDLKVEANSTFMFRLHVDALNVQNILLLNLMSAASVLWWLGMLLCLLFQSTNFFSAFPFSCLNICDPFCDESSSAHLHFWDGAIKQNPNPCCKMFRNF